MGARPSRRRQPADPPIALDALPPELLVLVLSHVPPRALVTRCRPVCRAWRDVVDGPSVWLLQLARDRSAEGRALYAVAQRCPPNSEDEEEFPLCALARYCLRSPLGRNLIFNSCGEQGFRGWEVEHGGNGWAVEKNLTLVPGAPSQTCFVTSFEWCFKRQLVDLVMEGVWQELLDSAQIEICVADWGIKAHGHMAGGAPERTAAASTGSGSAFWTCMKMKWSSSQPHPTRSFSGLREAADRSPTSSPTLAKASAMCLLSSMGETRAPGWGTTVPW
ncbi:F-box only protein 17 isoform X5 [Rhinolophus sinicus]|uniref:F-box only protein 17 isoform X5 n=1 Tax=Rhinolophus sinicus TaxID=89399 RepID=UPI003D7B3A37